MESKGKAIIIDSKDNVATLLDDVKKGMIIQAQSDKEKIILKVQDDIAFGHKIALGDIDKGEPIIKYGEIIGQASKDIKKGEHVHVHNVDSQRGRSEAKDD
ncbi:MAG: UxaA family hydrolase [Peptococcaceae bacterium]|jgi:altronate dehydratase small subunit|nr:UxaA family hydrolase [Peptococcaceae bacterium]MDH7525375.1 UxaA family hydrolase [Peptococcaceae bacterium]